MKRTLLALALVVLVAGAASAGVVGTKHDFSSSNSTYTTYRATNVNLVCVFCHTPHQPTAQSQDPLWNHTKSSNGLYGVYNSDTLNASPTNFQGSGSNVSALCMSCHDGTVGIGSLYNDPNVATPNNNATKLNTGSAYIGTDLSNDHPVNFTYDSTLSTADGGLWDPTSNTTVSNLLFGGTVQCASCHDPHDATYAPFLAKSNAQSALCTTCHKK